MTTRRDGLVFCACGMAMYLLRTGVFVCSRCDMLEPNDDGETLEDGIGAGSDEGDE